MFWNDPSFISEFLRGFFSILDSIGYFFLNGIFNIFFTIANASFFQGDVINTFYSRVQMILGIFMIFRLTLTFLEIIVNPDLYKDKQKGAASLVKRIAIMLILLSVIVPIDIPNTNGNTLNEQINNNGILFGLLYQFQNSVVEDNILGKLILGSKTASTTSNSGGLQLNGMQNVGDVITSDIAKAFITPTLNDGYDDITAANYEEAAACHDIVGPYFNPLVTSEALLDHINDTCNANGETYAFSYTGFGGVVVAIVMTIIIIGFTLDVAVRAIKLALLRLIAPIPIISYISPGQEKDGAFGNWVKTLTSTYLSLFIRLIIIYFGIYLIILLREGNLVTWVGTSSFITSALADIFIIIGILVFMKEAPKFFQDMLGIKGDGKLFSGIGTMLGAAALTGGLAGSFATGYRAYREERPDDESSWNPLRGLGAVGAGVTSAFGGAFVGAKALATSDKNRTGAVFSAMQKRNAVRASGSTLFGRASAGASAIFAGQAQGAHDEKLLEVYDNVTKAAKAHKTMAEEEALKDMSATGFYVMGKDSSGNDIVLEGNYQRIVSQLQQARAESRNYIDLDNGTRINDIDKIDPNVLEKLKESQTANYLIAQSKLKPEDRNAKLVGTAEELDYATEVAQMDVDAYDLSSIKQQGIGVSMTNARHIRANRKRQRYIANSRAIGGPPPGGGGRPH